jgi:hypothetical protein
VDGTHFSNRPNANHDGKFCFFIEVTSN